MLLERIAFIFWVCVCCCEMNIGHIHNTHMRLVLFPFWFFFLSITCSFYARTLPQNEKKTLAIHLYCFIASRISIVKFVFVREFVFGWWCVPFGMSHWVWARHNSIKEADISNNKWVVCICPGRGRERLAST